jgi:predicted thioesterase
MRAFTLALAFCASAFCAMAAPCAAQTVLKAEPLMLAPYEVAFVHNAACAVGQVLKVTGAIRGLNRRKTCVTLATEQASLATATP